MSVRNGLVVLSLILSILIGVSLSRSNKEVGSLGPAREGTVIGLSWPCSSATASPSASPAWWP